MLKIKKEELTHESFAPFGSFYCMTDPAGHSLNGEIHRFFPDRLTESYNTRIGFSSILVKKPEEMIIEQVEYHTTTPEIILPLNDDMILHVAPASAGVPVTSLTKAFLVPKGVMVKVNTAIWHLAPLPANESELQALIILPECTYVNDCTVVKLKEDEKFQII
ncbi:MAG: DUF4867 family protein [Muricomes sp.]